MADDHTIALKQKIKKLQSEAAERRIRNRELEDEVQQLKADLQEALARKNDNRDLLAEIQRLPEKPGGRDG